MATASITGSVSLVATSSVTGSVGITNVVNTTVSNFPVTQSVFVGNFPATQTVTGSVGITNVVTITGSVTTTVAPSTLGFAGTGSLAPVTGSFVGGKDAGGLFQALSITTGNALFVSGNVTSSIAGTVTVTGSVSLVATASITGSVSLVATSSITGSVSLVATASITGSVGVTTTVTTTNITFVGSGSMSPPTGSLVGTKDQAGLFQPLRSGLSGALSTYLSDEHGAQLALSQDPDNRLRVEEEYPLFVDEFDGTTLNLNSWATTGSTMTQTQAAGAIVLNANNTLTSGTFSSIATQRYFSLNYNSFLVFNSKTKFSASVNSMQEIGYGIGQGGNNPVAGQTIANGIFFRVSGTSTNLANIYGVYNKDGTETSVSLGTVNTTSYYDLDMTKGQETVRFYVSDMSGTIVGDSFLNSPSNSANFSTQSHLPAFARVYNIGASPTGSQLSISTLSVLKGGAAYNRTYNDFIAGNGRGAISPPLSSSIIANISNSMVIPPLLALSNTVASYTTLGGKFKFLMPSGSAIDYPLFAYQVPSASGFSLVVNGVTLQAVNLGTNVTTTATVLEWELGVGATAATLNTTLPGGPLRTVIGVQALPIFVAASASGGRIGDMFVPPVVNYAPRNPLVVHPGRFFHVILTVPTGSATAANIVTGFVNVDAYWE